MKKIALFFCFILISSFFISCEKEIDVSLVATSKNLVVEGRIEENLPPYLFLTYSIGFFQKIDLSKVPYASGAQVKVTDLTTNVVLNLKEYNIDSTVGGESFKFIIYGPDINDPNALSFVGVRNHTYKLEILLEGKTYTSTTKIPDNPGIDSLWLEKVPNTNDTFSVVKGFYQDPDSLGNAIIYETRKLLYQQTNNQNFFRPFNYAFDDQFINGTKVPLNIDIGFDRTQDYENDFFRTLNYLKKGDTLDVRWLSLDKPVFDFWNSVNYSSNSTGNPFAAPTGVKSNIEGGALGVWAGYGVFEYRIIDSL